MLKNAVDYIFFDMGGTLLDYDPVPWEEMKSIRNSRICTFLKAKGYDFTTADIDRCLLDPYYDLNFNHAEKTLEEVDLAGCTRSGLEALGVVEDYSLWIIKIIHRALRENLIIYDGTFETLEKLHGKYPLGLLSNTTIPGVFFAGDLDEIGMSKYFRHMLFTADLGMRKPHRSVFERILKLTGAPAERSLYVGDSFKNDIFGPSRLGMKTAWVNPQNKPVPAEFKDVRPDIIIKSVADLAAIF